MVGLRREQSSAGLYERHEKRLSQAEIFLPSRKRAGEGFLEDLYDAVDVV